VIGSNPFRNPLLISSSGYLNGQGQDAKQVTTARAAALDTVKSMQRGQHASSQSYALPVQLVVQANDAVSGANARKSQPVIIDFFFRRRAAEAGPVL
jgi:hypothetical protein